MTLLSVRGLVKRFGERTVVKDVSYHVDQGEIVGLLGPNGAGKTTTFRMTVGMITPGQGTVLLGGHDITREPMQKRARLGMGYLSQEPSIFRHMTVTENLLAVMEARGLGRSERKQRAAGLLEEFGLEHVARSRAVTLSGGERRRLELARTLSLDPTLILLDEPFSGVDPIAVEDIQVQLRRLRDRGIAILITDHAVRETLGTTDRAYIIYEGAIFRHGTAATLADDPQVRAVYLGEKFSLGEQRPSGDLGANGGNEPGGPRAGDGPGDGRRPDRGGDEHATGGPGHADGEDDEVDEHGVDDDEPIALDPDDPEGLAELEELELLDELDDLDDLARPDEPPAGGGRRRNDAQRAPRRRADPPAAADEPSERRRRQRRSGPPRRKDDAP